MTVFCVRSIYFEPLVGFTNNSAQRSSMISRCALRMFDQGRFKVKVVVQGLTLYDCSFVRSLSFEPEVGFTINSAQMSTMISQCAVHMFDKGHIKIKGIVQG